MSHAMLAHSSTDTQARREPRSWFRPSDLFSLFVRADDQGIIRTASNSDVAAGAVSTSETNKSGYPLQPSQSPGDAEGVQVSRFSDTYSRDVLREVNAAVSNANGVIDANGLRPEAAARLMDYVGGEWVDFKVMHKLLYFSEVATRYLSDGKWGFVQGTFLADETGPILSELEPVSPSGSPRDKITDVVSVGPYAAIAQHTYELFGDLSADLLSEISHVTGGAWEKTRERKSGASDGMFVMLREQIMSDYKRIFEDHGTI